MTTAEDLSRAALLEQQGDAATERDAAAALYQQAQRLLLPTGVLWSDRAEYDQRMLGFSRLQEKLYGLANRAVVPPPPPAAPPPAAAEAGEGSVETGPGQSPLARIGQQLELIEAEMKRIGYWSAAPPDLRAKFETGEMRSYLDAPSFELWLQQVFIPNARDAVAGDALPQTSQVGLAALRQYDYHSQVPQAEQLLALLNRFDEMVEDYGRSRP
jgi:uncharacterized protein YqcC (DUF446 family)